MLVIFTVLTMHSSVMSLQTVFSQYCVMIPTLAYIIFSVLLSLAIPLAISSIYFPLSAIERLFYGTFINRKILEIAVECEM